MVEHVAPLPDDVANAVSIAMAHVLPDELASLDPLVRRSDHADFQSNIALSTAKRAGKQPRELAEELAKHLADLPWLAWVGVAGPGFLNLSVGDAVLLDRIRQRHADSDLGVAATQTGAIVTLDYSGPNIAKEMHVGHIRSTVIGDALARVLDFLGATVIRQNHVGDWGTQFGMLIQYVAEHPGYPWRGNKEVDSFATANTVSALERLYRTARARFDADEDFKERAQRRVVALQQGDEKTTTAWREIVAESEAAFQEVYAQLGVLLAPDDVVGESFYNPWLQDVVDELDRKGILEESDGALCVFFDDILSPDGTPVPLLVRKRDGGFGYAATDLATIRYRIQVLKATRLLYVVDARQSQHFQMILRTARHAGWLTDDIQAVHVQHGTIAGPDGRPFKTRSGNNVHLTDLLDDAVARARAVVNDKDPALAADELDQIAEQAGIGAVKYADLSSSRVKDYVFDVDRMVSFNGNTGVYLQYAHTRIRSILRKAGDLDAAVDPTIELQPAERALALELDAYGAALSEVSSTLEPHRLCGYLYDLTRDFTTFYEACHVLGTEEPVRSNRLILCQLTARTLRHGLGLLGISTPRAHVAHAERGR